MRAVETIKRQARLSGSTSRAAQTQERMYCVEGGWDELGVRVEHEYHERMRPQVGQR